MKSNSRYLVFFILDVKFELNSCLPFSLEVELFTVTGAVECGDPDGNSNALNGEAIIGKLLCIKILLFYAFIMPSLGDSYVLLYLESVKMRLQQIPKDWL